jgi:dGTPase
MKIREALEKKEKETLSPYATFSADSAGRERAERECDYRTAFQRDRDKILHSKSFRRLKHKTQVFISPTEDHYRTRLTHTLEVSQIARTITRALALNEDLAEAIAIGHDLGHTPFGHAGEEVLNSILKHYGTHFKHNEQSIRIIRVLEKNGRGLNLTKEVIDGIKNHPRHEPQPKTLEGQIVRLSDRFAYIRHDIEDSLRAKVISKGDLPKKFMRVLGDNLLDVIVADVIKQSMDKSKISMSRDVEAAVNGLYDFMYKQVYTNYVAKAEEEKIPNLMRMLFRHYLYNPANLPGYSKNIKDEELLQMVTDFIAGMTDRFAINKFSGLFIPSEWREKKKPKK